MVDTFIVGKDEMKALATRVLNLVMPLSEVQSIVIHLEGDLGAGKTTFAQEFASLLGVKESVVSPTFVLKKEYESTYENIHTFVHVDAYRFINKEEGRTLLLEENDRPGTVILIEWPGNMYAPTPEVQIKFVYINESSREAIVTSHVW